MTGRNLKQELSYSTYIDMEYGNDTETLDFLCLIELLTEYQRRIKRLEDAMESASLLFNALSQCGVTHSENN